MIFQIYGGIFCFVLFCLLVVHFVDSDGHVLGIGTTRVHVAIVLGHQVNIVKTITIVIVLIEGVYERGVHDYCFVERSVSPLYTVFISFINYIKQTTTQNQLVYLFGNVDAIFKLLAL